MKIFLQILTVSRNCKWLLSERIADLERNAVNNDKYHPHESREVNSVPAWIGDVFESSFCKAISLTGHEVKPDDLQARHRLKKKSTVNVKFKCRKQKHSILINRKNLVINSIFPVNLSFLVCFWFRRACATRNISYLLNVHSWKCWQDSFHVILEKLCQFETWWKKSTYKDSSCYWHWKSSWCL